MLLGRVPSFFFPADRALHTEILPRPRGVAASGFPPLCNIPHCCLPQESGPCLSPNVAGRPLRPATDRRFGGPLPRQLPNQTRAPPVPPQLFTLRHAALCAYAVLAAVSGCYPPVRGRLPTRSSPVRHSVTRASPRRVPPTRFVRLACVRRAASVHPEPGSNSHVGSLDAQLTVLVLPFLYRCWSQLSLPFSVLEFFLFEILSRLFHCSVVKVRFLVSHCLPQQSA